MIDHVCVFKSGVVLQSVCFCMTLFRAPLLLVLSETRGCIVFLGHLVGDNGHLLSIYSGGWCAHFYETTGSHDILWPLAILFNIEVVVA